MTEENPLTIAELGAYTNNSMNREGIKKLVDKVNNTGEIPEFVGENGITVEENVIKLSNDWVECENKLADIVTYKGEYDYLVVNESDNLVYSIEVSNRASITTKTHLNNYYCKVLNPRGSSGTPFDAQLKVVSNSDSGSIQNIILTETSVNLMTNLKGFALADCKFYDFSGVTIDSTNIDDYLDAENNYRIKKPFIAILNKPSDSTRVTAVIIDVVGYAFYYYYSNHGICSVNVVGIYKFIKGESITSPNEYNITRYITSLVNNTTLLTFSSSNVKLYRRKKLSKIPTP